jgi:hypothetical protein
MNKVMKALTIKTAQEGDASVIRYHAVIHLTSKKIYFNCRVCYKVGYLMVEGFPVAVNPIESLTMRVFLS